MSDVEQRLRNALNARADLVHPEDLSLDPVYEPPEPDDRPWWQRPGAYLFIAAVAVIVIALPLLAIAATNPGGDPEPGPAESPTDDPTMTDPVPMLADSDRADVDGDGELDDIRVMSTEDADAILPDFEIEVALSSSGTTVTYPVGEVRGVKLGATANVDGRKGEEVIAGLEPESVDLHRAAPVVISLRDDELVPILADELDSGGDPATDGKRTYWWVHDGELWWWQSAEPVPEDVEEPFPVDVLRFPREATLHGVPQGTFCVKPTAQLDLLDCDEL